MLIKLFTVRNGVKQGGVLSHLLFDICTDSLLKILEETGVGCHMGGHFAGALSYADNITAIAQSVSALDFNFEREVAGSIITAGKKS